MYRPVLMMVFVGKMHLVELVDWSTSMSSTISEQLIAQSYLNIPLAESMNCQQSRQEPTRRLCNSVVCYIATGQCSQATSQANVCWQKVRWQHECVANSITLVIDCSFIMDLCKSSLVCVLVRERRDINFSNKKNIPFSVCLGPVPAN